jgi:hypothetical protein
MDTMQPRMSQSLVVPHQKDDGSWLGSTFAFLVAAVNTVIFLCAAINAVKDGAWLALRAYFLEPSRRCALDDWKAKNNVAQPEAALGVSQPKLKHRQARLSVGACTRCLFVAPAIAGPRSAPPRTTKRSYGIVWSLLYGGGPPPLFPSQQDTASTARGVAAMMEVASALGVDVCNSRVLTDDASFPGRTGGASRSEILDGMKWLVSGARAGDTCLLYFCGIAGSQNSSVSGHTPALLSSPCFSIDSNDIQTHLYAHTPVDVKIVAVTDCVASRDTLHSGEDNGNVFGLQYMWAPHAGAFEENLPAQSIGQTGRAMPSVLAITACAAHGAPTGALARDLAAIVQRVGINRESHTARISFAALMAPETRISAGVSDAASVWSLSADARIDMDAHFSLIDVPTLKGLAWFFDFISRGWSAFWARIAAPSASSGIPPRRPSAQAAPGPSASAAAHGAAPSPPPFRRDAAAEAEVAVQQQLERIEERRRAANAEAAQLARRRHDAEAAAVRIREEEETRRREAAESRRRDAAEQRRRDAEEKERREAVATAQRQRDEEDKRYREAQRQRDEEDRRHRETQRREAERQLAAELDAARRRREAEDEERRRLQEERHRERLRAEADAAEAQRRQTEAAAAEAERRRAEAEAAASAQQRAAAALLLQAAPRRFKHYPGGQFIPGGGRAPAGGIDIYY